MYTTVIITEVDRARIKPFLLPEGDCLLWAGAVTNRGYGTYKLQSGLQTSIHRIMYIAYHGSVPDGLVVMHTCNEKLCVAEAHLIAGTQQQNSLDALEDGLCNPPYGEQHWHSVLDEDVVRYVRGQANDGRKARSLSNELSIARQTIQDVIVGKTWKHVV